ncbi:MAG: class I SAM-dependent methyltransferase [Gammaproteobacteria bacterium]|nr:class I SAM-dependent methyltransferase [Gammaproteobacteria bacterium]NIX02130.1 hypothetical protein [Phycisphaerae bacterium]
MDIGRLIEENQGIFLDIGCGANKQEGFIGMDMRDLPGVDIVHDVEEFPWPLPDDCARLAMASHLVEHINPHKGVFIHFMNEVWRVMKTGGQFAISTPHGSSQGYIQDPTHCNPCNEATWDYFCPERDSGLWSIYRPRPWRVHQLTAHPAGNMEVVLIKLSEVIEK